LKQLDDTQANIQKEHQLRNQIDSIKNANLQDQASFTTLPDPYIEYVDVDSLYYLYTNIGTESFLQIKNRSQVDSLIDLVETAIHQRESTKLELTLTKLYSDLIPIDLKRIEEITFITDGGLSYLPFDILMHNDRYLIQDMTVKYRQSAFDQDRNHQANSQNKILCLTPQYTTLPISNSNTTRGGLSALAYTQEEIAKIAEVFPRSIESYNYLGLDELNNEIKEANIFHFAGHAIARNDSAYLVQMDNGRMELIQDNQILEMTNQLDLVTLSACETGLGTYNKGEGIESLATSFLNSGAQSIVYSLWNVNDGSTSDIMKVFYQQLGKGKNKAGALRSAKLDYLKQASPDTRHPYYWAAFCMVGDDSKILSDNYSWFILAALFFLAALILFHFKTKPIST